jgi:hypothetical protein
MRGRLERLPWPLLAARAKRLLPTLCGAFVLSVLVLVRPVQQFIGSYAFLVFPFF